MLQLALDIHKVENTVKSVKRLFNKAYKSGQDPYNSLLEFRNTPLDGTDGYAPTQLLNSRMLKSKLPTATKLLKPHVVPPMIDKLKARQQKQKAYYDRTASNNIPQPYPGDTVRFRNPRNQWYGKIQGILPQPRCVEVETPSGKIYKRNRRHTFPTKEKPPPQELIPEYQPIEPDTDNNTTSPDDNRIPEHKEPVCPNPSLDHSQISKDKYDNIKIRPDTTTRSGRSSKGSSKMNM